ncbi:MAG: class I SAM-dependent methyltransferase [Methylophilaceae bacterium]|uniref:class I SAM-dependent methyltransferase n=1 Tax=Methylicorpusculum sp. TaxID=2713644 RepID=UPI002731C476|nr:class I SAM-dependent methyltransferase [Methylicorpusculum sp.]MDP2178381.1 class I SAM-dependent methyltransferase [Methylicorpusculum sp.]MDP3530785.1 class I SAM-dependent methyltransferase [Methylicorpusculum sp.]MDZ4099323.1 class I SAM-dependent methyltransferase [Methylophilaceae bacterium]
MIIDEIKQLLWATLDQRRSIEDAGVKVTPCNFYSSVPSIAEIENSFEYSDDQPPYANSGIFGLPDKSRDLLEVLTSFSSEFEPPDEGDTDAPIGYFWNNSQFSHSDAMSYYTFVRHLQPSRVLEIGAGFSTLVAIDAIAKNGEGEVVFIEPLPRNFLKQTDKIVLKQMAAQEISVEWLNSHLKDGDVIFIDSRHTVKTGSDCLHIYLRLLPQLKHDIYLHVHDVFLPFGLPKNWLLDHHIYWTEQYLLLAFLTDNPRVAFLFGSAYHKWANEILLDTFMHGRAKSRGGSFWFKYSGSSLSL